MENHNTDLMKKLFTTAFFVAKNEKPYTDFVKLTELQAANYGDEILTKHYNSDKQANEFIHYILLLILSIVKPQFNFAIAKKRKINV